MTPDHIFVMQRISGLFDAVDTLDKAIREAIATLPHPPTTESCCEDSSLLLIERGVERWLEFEYISEEEVWMALYRDMGDEGSSSHIVCANCFTMFSLPDDIEWS